MKGTMLKLLGHVTNLEKKQEIGQKIQELPAAHDAERWFQGIRQILEELSEQLKRESDEKASGPILEIRQYIEENYQDPQLNLNDVADHFHLTPSYLSQLFKDQMDINFSCYLEDLRIEAACEYLNQKMPIHQVSEKVGYNSVYVFRNAFKRKMGVPPSSYRQS